MFTLHEIIIYILSCFLPTVQKDLYTKKLMDEINNNNHELDILYDNFINELHYN